MHETSVTVGLYLKIKMAVGATKTIPWFYPFIFIFNMLKSG